MHFALLLPAWVALLPLCARAELEPVRVADDGRGFVLGDSGRPFRPWGFNYDHDEDGRLIEDYWNDEWPKVVEDFAEMRDLGANVVRVHLQFGRFMEAADRPRPEALARLRRMIELAEQNRLYLDLTGLGCYHKADVPEWYDALPEADRWRAQALFWEAIARVAAGSPAIFCYDLMNEPVVPGGARARGAWLGPAFAGKHFVQFITLDSAGRPRPEIARLWIETLVAAIRRHDQRHMITVGLVDWSLDRPGLTSGFVPARIHHKLDFLCVHLYPEAGKLDAALEILKGFNVGKPVVIEEIFPLKCSAADLGKFIGVARDHSAGLVGFYWGKTIEECRKSGTLGDAIMLAWLELFANNRPRATPPAHEGADRPR